MELNADYQPAVVLSHVEAVYRPGDRQLAIELFKVLGCKVSETDTKSPAGSTYITVHPNHDESGLDNVIYLSEMPAEQCSLEAVLQQHIDADSDLRAARDRYQQMANDRPFGLCHVAIRYPSFESLEKVLETVQQRLTPELEKRFQIKIFRPGESDDIGWDSIQAFVYTDIAVAGILSFGQVFELAAYNFPQL